MTLTTFRLAHGVWHNVRGLLAFLGSLSIFAPPAHADDFYRTRPLTLVVGYAVGGGYDVYARLLARHLPKHIPGSPTIIVQNMPGAGSLRAIAESW
jgi:tripartite-type tricarboxylate transporter receptor subunit TctC